MGDNWIEGIVYEKVERGGMRKKRDEELLASYRDITFGITVIARVSSVRNLTASYQVKAPFKFFCTMSLTWSSRYSKKINIWAKDDVIDISSLATFALHACKRHY